MVARTLRTPGVFNGPRTADLPDLIVQWAKLLPTEESRGPRVGLIRGRDPELRAGMHQAKSILIAKGPGIPSGARMPNADLVDVPPTVFRLLGLPPHESLDGRPIADVVAGVEPKSQGV